MFSETGKVNVGYISILPKPFIRPIKQPKHKNIINIINNLFGGTCMINN